MIIVNGQKAILRQFNRTSNESIFDDQNYKDVNIKCVPYNVEQGIAFGIYTTPEATGYYQVSRFVDVRQGDQIKFVGNYKENNDNEWHTILRVDDGWLFNRIENYVLVVK